MSTGSATPNGTTNHGYGILVAFDNSTHAWRALEEAVGAAFEQADPATTSGIGLRIAREGDEVRISVTGDEARVT